MQADAAVEFRFLNQEDVKEAGVFDTKMVVETIEEVFRLHAEKKNVLPYKVVLRWGDVDTEHSRGRINAMPAYVGGDFDMAGIKWISSFPANRQKGLPRAIALVILNDPRTGVPLAVMDGALISAMRTGAVTGVAAKYLAKRDSKNVCMVGTGVIARTNLLALREVLPDLEEIRAYSIDPAEKLKAFEREMTEKLNIDVRTVEHVGEAIREADVIVTATLAREPVVKDPDLVKPGCFIANVGGYECSFDVVKKSSKVVVDDWEQVKHRGAQTLAFMYDQGFLKDGDVSELGRIVVGREEGRVFDEQTIFFNPVGMGVEDVAVGLRIYESANKKNLGTKINLWTKPHWI